LTSYSSPPTFLVGSEKWTKAQWIEAYGKLLRELSFLEGKYAKAYYENERLRNEVTHLVEKEWEDVK